MTGIAQPILYRPYIVRRSKDSKVFSVIPSSSFLPVQLLTHSARLHQHEQSPYDNGPIWKPRARTPKPRTSKSLLGNTALIPITLRPVGSTLRYPRRERCVKSSSRVTSGIKAISSSKSKTPTMTRNQWSSENPKSSRRSWSSIPCGRLSSKSFRSDWLKLVLYPQCSSKSSPPVDSSTSISVNPITPPPSSPTL